MATSLTRLERQRLADKWAGEKCTLDGKPASISGRLCNFATIGMLYPGTTRVEFAWETVDRIMSRDGKFQS